MSEPIRVFLVDDHKSVLWGLEQLVASAAPRMRMVGKATNCAEALAGIDAERPDVVLLDLDLGSESGFDLLPRIRDRARVLVLSGARDPELDERVVTQGARGFVNKIQEAQLILRAIEAVHAGELWIERGAMSRVIEAMTRRVASEREREAASGVGRLTPKEREVVAVVVEHRGAPTKVIADALHLSAHTLRNHLASIYQKLDVHNRIDLYTFAKQHGLG